MTEPSDLEFDRRKVRIGLATITLVVLVAVVLFVLIDDPIGRAIMFGVAAVGLFRAYLLSRSLRHT
jgi:hypothetical protein